jgi:phage shock protein A
MSKPSIRKRTVFWLLGDNAGRITVGIWNWLWGKSIAGGGEITIAVADESFADIQRSVQQLTEAVAKMTATYQKIKEKYEVKKQELQEAKHQAKLAMTQGNQDVARVLMGKVITIESLLPQLQKQMLTAEKILLSNRDRLQKEREKLEQDRQNLESSKVLAEFNVALAQIQNIDHKLDANSSRSQLNIATNAVYDQYLNLNASAELSQDPHEQTMNDFLKSTYENEITLALQELDELLAKDKK